MAKGVKVTTDADWEARIAAKQEAIAMRIGLGQVRILEAVIACGKHAYGLAVFEHVRNQGGNAMSDAQVYVSLKRMASPQRGLVEVVEKRRVPGTPPITIYGITAKGRKALALKKAELKTLAG